jgi:glycosyltransferase involved in cell wall biosynthesis
MESPKNKALSPSISIITVVFNGENLLEGTILSVKNQTYPFIEHLIIDGASKDNTLQIIKSYAAKMPNMRWISERDNGIYDAMNKGIKMATGDFVWFINAGDELHNPETVALMAKKITPVTDVVFGETMLVNDAREPLGTMSELSTRKLPGKDFTWKNYINGMIVVHQSFVARRSHCEQYIPKNLCADYHWCINLVKSARNIAPSGIILSNYLVGGVSKQRHKKSLIDRFWVMQRHFGIVPTIFAHVYFVFRAGWHKLRNLGKVTY